MMRLLLLFVVSSGLCCETSSSLGTGTSPAVCQPDTCALLSEVAALKERLAASMHSQSSLEQNLQTMIQKMANVEANMQLWKSQREEQQRQIKTMEEHLKVLVNNKSERLSDPAFTVALGVSFGPYSQNMAVKYGKVVSNISSGYNPSSGVFTARTRGVYYFSYTMYNNNFGKPNSVVSLMKNNQRLVSTWDTEGSDIHDSATNAAVVTLEPGDSVYVNLYAQRALYDDHNYYNTFSGFLIRSL